MKLHTAFQAWLDAGGDTVGQVALAPLPTGGYRLTHLDDATIALRSAEEAQESQAQESLELFTRPEEARAIALYGEEGQFRPLKSAPNLRRGWRLELASVAELQLAIEFFYPAALGVWVAWEEQRLARIPLQETLQRQSGMYAVTKKATAGQIAATMASCCNTNGGCLKTILWATPAEQEVLPADKFLPESELPQANTPPPRVLPLLCNEACNIFIGALRTEIKK